jgi:hypothetical protein
VRANEITADADAKHVLELKNALDEATLQRKLREDAERRAQAFEATLETLRQQQAEARAEVVVAARKEAAAIARESQAEKILREAIVETKRTQMDVPLSFVLDAAKALLSGNRNEITTFVSWGSTPQGHTFWSAESARLERGEDLTAEARRAIMDWVERASRE